MKYADYFALEQPTFQVFTEEEIELGDIPVEEKKADAGGKDNREAKKAERLAARQKKVETATEEVVKKDPNDPSAHLFGDRDLIRSQVDP
jgi:hypothetical protein